jgi:hypothetical protein
MPTLLGNAAAMLALLPLCSCVSWASIRVHDPNGVAVRIGDDAELTGNSGVASVSVTKPRLLADDQHVIAQRGEDGRVVLDVPARRNATVACEVGLAAGAECDKPAPLQDASFRPVAGTEETLVDAQGHIATSAYVPNAESYYWDGGKLVMRHVYARYQSEPLRKDRPLTYPFEVWMTTRASNVDVIESHRQPVRGLGWIALGVAVPFALGTVALLANRDPDVRAAGAYLLGIPALAFGGAGAVLLTWPESVTREYPGRDAAAVSMR